MIPKHCKRLAEVDFPIADVSRHAAREKSIRHGHPSTLHLWWARRPLASSRAVLLGLLWPDPCDPMCPAEFKAEARKRLREVGGCDPGTTDEHLRRALLRFIADFSNWDNAAHRTYLDVSRALVKAAYAPSGGDVYEPPLVVDPFAGGGSIPLEALRVGCEAFASDLNPVACLILKVMLEDIPRHGPELAEDLRRVGAEIKKEAEKALGELYPPDPDGATPIAYLWARTVRCESPNCGAELPLVRSFWLCKKASRRRALRHRVERPKGQPPRVELEIFEPHSEGAVPSGFASGGKAKCPVCHSVLSSQRVRAQLSAEHGGSSPRFDEAERRIGGARLLAVVTSGNFEGRAYRAPTHLDYQACWRVSQHLAAGAPIEHINPVRPSPNARGLSAVTRYGMSTFSDLYTRRQLEALMTVARIVSSRRGDDLTESLALAVGRAANAWTSLCRWHQSGEKVEGAFNGQKIPMVWDFAEASPFSGSTGGWDGAIEWVAAALERLSTGSLQGQVQQADAAVAVLPDASAAVWFTDPPYYDAVPYADLADFFFVWLKRTLPAGQFGDPYTRGNPLSPKTQECVWNRSHTDEEGVPKTPAFFERKFADSAVVGRKTLREDGVACVVFAHKSTEGWESLLNGLTRGGFVVTASWPIVTEMAERTNARNTASLMGSVHLVCRPRPDDAGVGDWADVLRELPPRVGDWMERLQNEGVRGADLVFACIGPALEIFSRYKKVETAAGREVKLDEYLEKVWEVVGRTALGQVLGTAEARARNGAAGAVEEDARLTALFLWTLQATDGEGAQDAGDDEEEDDEGADDDEDEEGRSGSKAKGLTLVFDVVRRFAQPLGIDLPKWDGRVIETRKGVVRLLPVAERAKQLFGEDGAQTVASRIEQDAALGLRTQLSLFPDERQPELRVRDRSGRSGRRAAAGSTASGRSTAGIPDDALAAPQEATTLDRVHAAMLLQAGGRSNALRALVKAEQERSPDFLRLANALSALYPKGSEEKRLLDAMLLAVPR
jgi:adenine-specific DNA methylase